MVSMVVTAISDKRTNQAIGLALASNPRSFLKPSDSGCAVELRRYSSYVE